MMSEAPSAAEAARVQLHKPGTLLPDNVSEGGDDRNVAVAEQIGNL